MSPMLAHSQSSVAQHEKRFTSSDCSCWKWTYGLSISVRAKVCACDAARAWGIPVHYRGLLQYVLLKVVKEYSEDSRLDTAMLGILIFTTRLLRSCIQSAYTPSRRTGMISFDRLSCTERRLVCLDRHSVNAVRMPFQFGRIVQAIYD